jgi:excisionase family DNA binding protein
VRSSLPPQVPERLAVDYAQAAYMLGVSVGTVVNLVASGDLDAFRIRTTVRISVDALERYVADRLVDSHVGGSGETPDVDPAT